MFIKTCFALLTIGAALHGTCASPAPMFGWWGSTKTPPEPTENVPMPKELPSYANKWLPQKNKKGIITSWIAELKPPPFDDDEPPMPSLDKLPAGAAKWAKHVDGKGKVTWMPELPMPTFDDVDDTPKPKPKKGAKKAKLAAKARTAKVAGPDGEELEIPYIS